MIGILPLQKPVQHKTTNVSLPVALSPTSMSKLTNYLFGLPLEIAVIICNECLSSCSDQALNEQLRVRFPSIFFTPFLHKVVVGHYYVECRSKTGSVLKIYYLEENFTKFIQLLKEGHRIQMLEIRSDLHCEFEFMKVLVSSTKKLQLNIFPYLYLYFLKEHPESASKIYEFWLDSFDVFEVMQVLMDENIEFPNLQKISIKMTCADSMSLLGELMIKLGDNCFNCTNTVQLVHYVEIGHIQDIINFTGYRIKSCGLSNEYLQYTSKFALTVNNIEILLLLKNAFYIDLSSIYKLNVGILSTTATNLLTQHIPFMSNLTEITTYTQLNIMDSTYSGTLKNLITYRDLSSNGDVSLKEINNVNLPKLSFLSISAGALHLNTKIQIPETLRVLYINNYGVHQTNDFSALDFSLCKLKTLYVSVDKTHTEVVFFNLPDTLTTLVITATGNKSQNLELIKVKSMRFSSNFGRLFPNYRFVTT